MFESENKVQRDKKSHSRDEDEKKNVKLSSNDVSEDKSENTETVANVTQPRINTEGL